jgi:hypothetical protein
MGSTLETIISCTAFKFCFQIDFAAVQRGPTLFKDWRCHVADSVFITPEGHYTSPYRNMAPYYDPWKDVVIPGFMDGRKVGKKP